MYTDAMYVTKIKGQWEVKPTPQSQGRIMSGTSNVTFKQVEPSDLPQ